MARLIRFTSGCLFGGALLFSGSTLVAKPAVAQSVEPIVLVCTDTACCTVNSDTGAIVDCKRIR